MFHRCMFGVMSLAFLTAAPLGAGEFQLVDLSHPDLSVLTAAAAANPDPLDEPGFFEAWDVSLSLGFAGTKGNTRSQSFNAQLRADKETERGEWLG